MGLLHVPQHVAPLDVRLAALRTVVVLLAGVGPLVRHQVALADEVLRAHVAPEGPLHRLALGVAALVEQQVALERERLAALIALERTLSGMRPAGKKRRGGWSRISTWLFIGLVPLQNCKNQL